MREPYDLQGNNEFASPALALALAMNFFDSLVKIFLVRFIVVNSGRNHSAGPGKSIHFKEVSALKRPIWRGFVIGVS